VTTSSNRWMRWTTAAIAVLLAAGPAGAGTLELKSKNFADEADIPILHTCDGADRSPSLNWDGVPEDTKAFAIIVDDPDAAKGTWTHWLAWNLPSAARAIDTGVPTLGDLGDGTKQGKNDFGKTGYGGPCPPRGSTHEYRFRFFALSKALEIEENAERDEVLEAIEKNKIEEAVLTGKYRRAEKAEPTALPKPAAPENQSEPIE